MKKLDKFKPLIHSDCQIVDSNFGSFVEIGECSIISNSNFGDYSYCTRFCDIANTDIKKFSNIASSVRIGPTDHPMEKTSLHHFLYRSNDYWEDKEHDKNFFKNRYSRKTASASTKSSLFGTFLKWALALILPRAMCKPSLRQRACPGKKQRHSMAQPIWAIFCRSQNSKTFKTLNLNCLKMDNRYKLGTLQRCCTAFQS